jgi:hypothetical protein
MLGQMMKVSDENFALSIKQDPVIVVLDVISVKPKSLKAAVRKRDLKLIQELEKNITTEFATTAYKQCGFLSSDELSNYIDDTFVTSCGLHDVKDATVNLTLESPLSNVIKADETYAMSLRPVQIFGSSHILKIIWKVKRVAVPKHNPSNETKEGITVSLDAIEQQVRSLKSAEDTIDVISWLNEHNFQF